MAVKKGPGAKTTIESTNMIEPGTIYKQRIAGYSASVASAKKKDRFFIAVKLFLVAAGLFIFFRYNRSAPGTTLVLLGACFTFFIAAASFHEKVLKKMKHLQTLLKINEREAAGLEELFLSGIGTGEEFIEPTHPYASDLDIFGEHSLFHYLNRTVTGMGREHLAKTLKSPLEAAEIPGRHEAVKELRDMLDFRQELQAAGLTMEDTPQKLQSLYHLLEEKNFVLGKKGLLFSIYLLPLVTLGLFSTLFFGLPLGVPLLGMTIQMAVNGFTLKKVSHIYKLTSRHTKILKAYTRIISEIEGRSFESTRLGQLQQGLTGGEKVASRCIKRLSTLVEWFDVRTSAIHFFVNNILFWDLHLVYRIEKWKKQAGPSVPGWFEIIGETETLSSLANLNFNHPGWTFPRVRREGFAFAAENLGHPLIPGKERVDNDIHIEETHGILVITGPNMAGKSTLLRTLGIAAVMGFAGAPVCATSLELSPLRLVTSMQSSDSLDKHLSFFYAELQRLKMVIDAINESEETFFIIDEMLKGTNELDRHKGAVTLLRQLAAKKARGVLATHDLGLTELERECDGLRNFHFDGKIEGDRLVFDFKLTTGVCRSANALTLMKKIGIQL